MYVTDAELLWYLSSWKAEVEITVNPEESYIRIKLVTPICNKSLL